MKINGWQRIGILASIAWIIWSYNRTFDHLQYVDTKIAVDEEMACEQEHSQKGETFAQFFPICDAVGDSNGGMARATKASHDHSVTAIEEATLPVPFAWGAVYLALFLLRWVRRGFNTHSAKT